MPDDELPEGRQVRSRSPLRSFADWLMTLGVGVPWLFYQNFVWVFARRDRGNVLDGQGLDSGDGRPPINAPSASPDKPCRRH
jgi:hypothetical protein